MFQRRAGDKVTATLISASSLRNCSPINLANTNSTLHATLIAWVQLFSHKSKLPI